MIVDARYNPACLPLRAQVHRPCDGAWYDHEMQSWRIHGKLPGEGFPYGPVPGLLEEYSLAIPTPPETWGRNHDVIVYVFAYMDEEWQVVDRIYATVNPTFQIEGYHFIAEANKPGAWIYCQPQIK
jgi:hypothetical protein